MVTYFRAPVKYFFRCLRATSCFNTQKSTILRHRKPFLSCSGGNISKVITSIPGCSNYFLGSIVAYSNDIKENVLGISRKLIERYGAVSEEVVEKMILILLKLTK